MHTITRSWAKALLAAGMLLAAGAALAEVSVTYVKPEEFTDVPRAERDRVQLQKDLAGHFVKLGEKLPQGQVLKVEVLDIDLAGRLWPRRSGGEDIRVMKGGADWPHLHLRYTLEADGRVIAGGDEHLSNMMYQDRLNRYFSGDPLRYEKQMIDDWFDKTVAPARVAGR